jgi:tRNA (mo5U34)-methyltransferase
MKTAALQRDIERLGPWFHDLDLSGVRTAPDHPLGPFHHELWALVEHAFPADMTGCSVLDIGCNAGFYSFKLLERGATVTGIDHDARYLAQARLAADMLGHELDLRQMDVYDLDRLGASFDFVLFLGVFYHLRHPLYGLEKAAARARHRLVFQTMVRGSTEVPDIEPDHSIRDTTVFERPGFPAMYFIEHAYAGDATNWWIPNEAAAESMLRSSGLRILTHPGPGIYICAPRPDTGGGALEQDGASRAGGRA